MSDKSKKTYKDYPKTGQSLGCDGGGLTAKICRHNVSRTNPQRKPYAAKSKKEFVKDFKKSYDWRDVKVSIDSKDQQAAEETASKELINYLTASIDSDLSKIPFAKGTLSLYTKDRGLYGGHFQDNDGQIIEKFDDMTVALLAKNLEMKQLYTAPDSTVDFQEVQEDINEALNRHNDTYHKGQEPGEPINSGKGHIKFKYGDFELEIKKSIHSFVTDFRKAAVNKGSSKDRIRKAIKSWNRNFNLNFKNDHEAAKELMENWDTHQEGFKQILFAINQLNKKKNG